MKYLARLLAAIIILPLAFTSCHKVDEWDNNPVGNFDALWNIIDRHYCFFREKNINWDSVYTEYRPRVNGGTTSVELFQICSSMLDELRDGHVNLSGWYATSYYKKWWSDYPQNYDNRLVEENYLHFSQLQRNGLSYYILRDSVAYIRYPSFSVSPGESTLDWAIAILAKCPAMIIDIRDNGGGNLTNVEMIVRRFIDRRILAGYITHKSGEAHDAFSEPYAFYFDPAPEGRMRWKKPVVVLTNRSTFSAANNFASVMSLLPQVKIVGDHTGGGSGLPFSSELPCGWGIRFSASPVYDANMVTTEFGIAPDIHVDLDTEQALAGIDTMLETAIDAALDMAGISPSAPGQNN